LNGVEPEVALTDSSKVAETSRDRFSFVTFSSSTSRDRFSFSFSSACGESCRGDTEGEQIDIGIEEYIDVSSVFCAFGVLSNV
jgi:hypothetical protein